MKSRLNILYENLLPLIQGFTDNYPGYQAYEDTFVDQAFI